MRRPLSAYSKVFATLLGATATAVATALPNSAAGKWAAAIVAILVAMGLVERTRNTQTVETGTEPGPVTIAKVVSRTGAEVGAVVADTGTAAGGIVAGTTGLLGAVVDGTLGKLLPGGRHG